MTYHDVFLSYSAHYGALVHPSDTNVIPGIASKMCPGHSCHHAYHAISMSSAQAKQWSDHRQLTEADGTEIGHLVFGDLATGV